MKGDTILPTLDIMKQKPIPRLLTSVGKSSLANKVTVWNPAVMATFPIMANTITLLLYTEEVAGGGGEITKCVLYSEKSVRWNQYIY